MSGSTLQTNSKVVKWIDSRLPIFSMVNESLVVYPTPRNLNYWWNFGSLAGIALVIQIVTGVVLTMHYTPHVTTQDPEQAKIRLHTGTRFLELKRSGARASRHLPPRWRA